MKVSICRSDFRKSQDYPNESLFECVLIDLGIPEEKRDEIDRVELDVDSFEID